jgi:hypothetical protein
MSWKKYFKTTKPVYSNDFDAYSSAGGVSVGKRDSRLSEAYSGHPSRIQRYYQYSDMDKDSDISAILDLIADFCTQSIDQHNNPFHINYIDDVNETEMKILNNAIKRWINMNQFTSKLWYIFRQTLLNGDQFFISDKETGEWIWLEHYAVEMVKMDETKKPLEYVCKGLDINLADKYAIEASGDNNYRTKYGIPVNSNRPNENSYTSSSFSLAGDNFDHRNIIRNTTQKSIINADDIVHLSLSVGMDVNWPFGKSILDPIFKTFRQKQLMEDSIVLYRIQRAPERRIFYIDTGSMNLAQAEAYLEKVKAQIHQRKIPSKNNLGQSMIDAVYDPLSINDDYFFAQGQEGRGSKVETLPGGDNLGEIGDLSYFVKKLVRGLSIPPGYISFGDDSIQTVFNDGKVGTALIHEYRFNKFCMRLQALLVPAFDADFKKYLKKSGFNIDETIFELQFHPPQNFTAYKELDLDSARIQNYSAVADNKKISERFKLKKYLGWTDEEILENEKMWREENPEAVKNAIGTTSAETEDDTGLSSIGSRVDMGGMDDMPEPEEDLGDEEDVGGDDITSDIGDIQNSLNTGAGGGGAAPTGN